MIAQLIIFSRYYYSINYCVKLYLTKEGSSLPVNANHTAEKTIYFWKLDRNKVGLNIVDVHICVREEVQQGGL